MKEVETIILEDKLEYAIMDTILVNDTKYMYLGLVSELAEESKKHSKIVIRKLDKKEKNIIGLDNEEEYKMALETFVNKWKEKESVS